MHLCGLHFLFFSTQFIHVYFFSFCYPSVCFRYYDHHYQQRINNNFGTIIFSTTRNLSDTAVSSGFMGTMWLQLLHLIRSWHNNVFKMSSHSWWGFFPIAKTTANLCYIYLWWWMCRLKICGILNPQGGRMEDVCL